MRNKIIIAAFFLFKITFFCAAQNFAGVYTNNSIGLSLYATYTGLGKYHVQILLQGEAFTTTAEEKTISIAGSYTREKKEIPFKIIYENGVFLYSADIYDKVAVKKETPPSREVRPAMTLSIAAETADTYAPRASGSKVEHPSDGYLFTIPTTWMAENYDGKSHFFTCEKIPGRIETRQHSAKNIEELRALMFKSIYLKDKSGKPDEKATMQSYSTNGCILHFSGYNKEGEFHKAHLIGLVSAFGNGLLISADSHSNDYSNNLLLAAKSLANSVEFTEKRIETLSESWSNRLKFKQLYHKESTTVKIVFNLCGNGSYTYISTNEGSKDENTGNWNTTLKNGKIMLQLYDTRQGMKQFELSEGKIPNTVIVQGMEFSLREGTCGK
jgi:hypothetical protein